ncbi:MAG: M15 family metallopeptidase [Bacteroidales bacterium]|nr:M15 family metallopeptidase [Bacteroidales bacterium]
MRELRIFWGVGLLLFAAVCTRVSGQSVVAVEGFHPGDSVPAACLTAERSGRFFAVGPLPDSVFAFMQGKSYPAGCPVPRASLRYLTCLYKDIQGTVWVGEMVVHASIADDVLRVFRRLYAEGYPIERMRLVDHYGASDEASMRANNTSCFNFRFISGTRKVSKHGQGMAIDINPLYNPCFRLSPVDGRVLAETVEPSTARPYTDRTRPFPYKIVKGDLCWRLFRQYGFVWGGAWRSRKDYQHFERP